VLILQEHEASSTAVYCTVYKNIKSVATQATTLSYICYLQNIPGWFTEHTWVVYGTYLGGLQNIPGWFTEHTWVVYRTYLAGLQNIPGWFTEHTWLVYRTYLGGLQNIPGWFTPGSICTSHSVSVITRNKPCFFCLAKVESES